LSPAISDWIFPSTLGVKVFVPASVGASTAGDLAAARVPKSRAKAVVNRVFILVTIGGWGGVGTGGVGGALRATRVDLPAPTITDRPAPVTLAVPSATETVVPPRAETVMVRIVPEGRISADGVLKSTVSSSGPEVNCVHPYAMKITSADPAEPEPNSARLSATSAVGQIASCELSRNSMSVALSTAVLMTSF
jgi:hypothetical protein